MYPCYYILSYILSSRKKESNIISAPEHATDMIKKPADIEHQKTKIYTFQNFQFHFHCQVMS